MKQQFPAVRVRMPFSRGRAVLYEDYMAIEHMHSFGMMSEDSRTYYDEVRWVLSYRKRDWIRLVHVILLAIPLELVVQFLLLRELWILTVIGLFLTLAVGLLFLYSLYRLIFVLRGIAAVVSSRGTVYIGTDWPRSRNPLKDAGKFFENLLSRLKLVEEMPQPVPPPPPAPIADAAPPPAPPAEPPSPAA